MADIIDNASTLEDLQREAALSMHRLNHSAVSATHCEECGDQLSDARRKAYPGCTMCVECQSNMELRKKIGRM
ncbi:TraR/DksA family transcriptional regulator [Enterobacter hormaechei]|uniref:TraR/DksA family transcriptional regulator n=1 Tax=Enterobacter hormaechei TaxID=158836 RepID=UPI000BA08911|nr:TraR/DksA family transcriptional regulator [Enterobacter hormaechei]MBT1721877.1 TraR/DksA family transcriptional regulator [Enterobacter hormaechei subsp. hoffmannii]MCL8113609.1 TraR/DksA family transcriptional regulator [Enterobacter hormaechei]MCM8211733.1 TraR/DksA family transcriptional regulator [Enterobacter hormaechei]MDS0248894.1 TraR/DksA family transcriptional regulator [Enterobacter hormaechei]OZP41299.1 conjugal transfer protein TraR [Enterobacter hormaechei]